MKTLYRIYEFLFNRWKTEEVERKIEKYYHVEYGKSFTHITILYRHTNKFDGSVKYTKQILD